MDKEKAHAVLSISMQFSCPKCDAYLDAFSEEETGIINDEGQLWKIIDNRFNSDAWKNLGMEVTCYKCKHEFIFDSMEY